MNIGNYMYFQFGSHLHCNDGIASQTVSPVANMEQSESMYSTWRVCTVSPFDGPVWWK